MATVDNLGVGLHLAYAKRVQFVEDVKRQYHLDDAASVKAHASVQYLQPQLSELDILLGVTKSYAPWAYFLPPRMFTLQRKTPFTFSRVTPSVGSEEDEDLELLESIQPNNDEEKYEKEVLKNCINRIKTINEWLGYIVGRIGQLLQG